METIIIKRDLIAGVALFLLSIGMYIVTFGFGRLTVSQIGAEFTPRVIAIAIFGLSIILIFQSIRKWRVAVEEGSINDNETESTELSIDNSDKELITPNLEKDTTTNFKRYRNVIMTVGLVVLYVLLIEPVGFLISTTLYLIAHFFLLAERSYWNVWLFITTAIIVSLAIYYSFRNIFEIMLPSGLLG